MSQPVQGPDGKLYQFPEGTTKEAAVRYFKSKGLSGVPTNRVNDTLGKITGISAYKPKEGLAGFEEKMGDWRERLREFANRGSGSYNVGTTSELGDLMVSPASGAVRVARGASEVPQGKVWKGTKDVVGGVLEAGQIPGMMMAPEVGTAAKLLPSTEKAAGILEDVAKAANHIEVPHINRPLTEAIRIRDMANSGATMPKVVRNFLQRLSKPEPLTYKEARQFYENATRVSFDESNRLTPKAKYLLGKFTKALDTSIHEAAKTVGKGDEYAKGMRAYHSAAKLKDFTSRVKTEVLPRAAKGAAYTVGAGAGYKLLEGLLGAPHGH